MPGKTVILWLLVRLFPNPLRRSLNAREYTTQASHDITTKAEDPDPLHFHSENSEVRWLQILCVWAISGKERDTRFGHYSLVGKAHMLTQRHCCSKPGLPRCRTEQPKELCQGFLQLPIHWPYPEAQRSLLESKARKILKPHSRYKQPCLWDSWKVMTGINYLTYICLNKAMTRLLKCS